MVTLLLVVLAADPMSCLPTPADAQKHGDATAYKEAVAASDPKTPPFTTAPADARLLLRVIWNAAGNKAALKALRPLMEPQFTYSFGGDVDADQAVTEWAKDTKLSKALREALSAKKCTVDRSTVVCTAAKDGRRLGLEKIDGCWRWTSFVGGD